VCAHRWNNRAQVRRGANNGCLGSTRWRSRVARPKVSSWWRWTLFVIIKKSFYRVRTQGVDGIRFSAILYVRNGHCRGRAWKPHRAVRPLPVILLLLDVSPGDVIEERGRCRSLVRIRISIDRGGRTRNAKIFFKQIYREKINQFAIDIITVVFWPTTHEGIEISLSRL